MSRIRVLPDMLVKKIAAGEVIERPASVVKELMENAIDAGASQIAVSVEQGGMALIRITDNGCGMTAEDLALAVTPHATSKLSREEDLYQIGTLGFRGEALASIGAVSRMRITSKPHDLDEGAEIQVEAERVQSNRAAGCPAGTSIEVRDLFFNVPARRKFLRAAATEYGHINTQFARIALSHPRVAFDLKNNHRVVHQLPVADSLLDRIGAFYSRELADALMTFERDEAGLRIKGFAAPPADARSSTNWQLTFLNGRYIRDKNIQHAIRESFRGLVDPHRHPIVFLFLTIEPSMVDVNVHPTKIEVRWQDARRVHSQVLSSLRETLQGADLTPRFNTERAGAFRHQQPMDAASREKLLQSFAEEFRRTPPIQPSLELEPGSRPIPTPPQPQVAPGVPSKPADGAEVWRQIYGQPADTGAPAPPPQVVVSPTPQSLRGAAPHGAIQLHHTYLVCETDDGMVIIDQHALHERILFEQLKDRIAGGKLEAQRLLLPETVQLSPAQMDLLDEHAELLERIGLEVSRFGADTVAIQSAASLLKDTDVAEFLRDLVDKLEEKSGGHQTEHVVYDILSMMACKAAVKAGDPLTRDEIQSLVACKDLVEKSSNCPHGRPTTLRLTVQDLERQFKRT